MQSSFFAPSSTTKEGDLALLHISRDQSLPVTLSTIARTADEAGYAEGVVTNTRFGSFPHSTLLGLPWGSQVLASKVDTGSRGRGQKRKAKEISTDSPLLDDVEDDVKEIAKANSGFIHVLPPTPENWTTSLPHRTQVVYTPDYSYVLQRIRAKPGTRLVEAGSGSGSFTHAAARAVYDGSEAKAAVITDGETKGRDMFGKVFTYEFHAERHEKVEAEMGEHRLGSIVTATHRDVYKDGFWLYDEEGKRISPRANAIFLDLPAPWEALPHLTREETIDKPSALDPNRAVHVCTFSPCIEQVQKTVSEMRRQGWLDIEMMEIQHKRVDVKREYTSLRFEGMRGVNAVAATVDEALARLREVEENAQQHNDENTKSRRNKSNTQQSNKQQSAISLHWDEGKLIHRSEPELKTHTSYLVFAVLPREWTEEDEERARNVVPQSQNAAVPTEKSKKQMKKERKKQRLLNGGRQQLQGDGSDEEL